MEIKGSDLEQSDEELKDKESIEVQESGDLVYTKERHNILYKILKYNPIDSLNDYGRKILDKLDILETADAVQYWVAYPFVKEVMRKLWNFRIEGEMAPEYGPTIFVGNLQSHLDPFFISGAVHRRIRWMSKPDNFKTPIVKSIFKNLGAFKLDLENPDPAYEKAKEIISRGECVGIFPEGTRSEDGIVGEFEPDTVKLAIETGAIIVPMAVLGSREALPKGKLMIKPGQITVRIGREISYDDYYEKGEISYPEAKRLSAELRQEVIDLLEAKYIDGKLQNIKELSIGSPEDMEEKPKLKNFKSNLKKLGKDFVKFIDDWWYGLLKISDLVGLQLHFTETIFQFSAHIIDSYSNLMNPIQTIDFDKYMPKEGGAVVASGHNSEWDVIMIPLCVWRNGKRSIYQMSKQSLFKIPFVNAWIRIHYAFPLRRGEHDVGSYLYAKECLEEGHLVVIYPEGTTNPGGGQLLPGHTGSVRLAIEAKVPIIPVGVTYSENVFPKHAKMLNFGKGCIYKCGEPFMEHQKYWDKPMPGYEELSQLTDNMMVRIKDLLMYDNPEF